jgi:hypothetical protein
MQAKTVDGHEPQTYLPATAQRVPGVPATLGHALALQKLPAPLQGPFRPAPDHPSQRGTSILIRHDPVFTHYPVKVLW